MAGVIRKAYIAFGIVIAALSLYYLIAYRDQVETASQPPRGFQVLQPAEVNKVEAIKKDRGDTQIIRLELDGIENGYNTLMFYSIHQNVTVYYGLDSIYSMKPAKKNNFTQTPGCMWNNILLDERLNGKEIRVELTSVYPGISYELPVFYFGEEGPIVRHLISQEIVPFLASILLAMVGMAFIVYVLYNFKNSEVDKNLGMLGGFAFLIGMWKCFDLAIMKYFFSGFPVFSMMPFIALLLVVIPGVFFVMNLHQAKDSKIWLIPCWVSILVIYLVVLLQFLNIRDFRQNLILIWGVLVVAVLATLHQVVAEFRRFGWNAKLRRNMIGFAVIIIGIMMDGGRYLVSGGRQTSYFAILGFLGYTLVIGYFIVKESGALIVAGEGARSFENLAYHDKMTGCFNRSAFIVDTDPYAVEPEEYVVAVLDLNNLKKCNDTLGHEKGDQYIKDSAQLILSTFGKLGTCYRMGGDEFYCLIPKGGLAACKEQKGVLDKLVAEYNEKAADIHMGIACGFAKYDKRMDYDLNATAKRADKMMYKNKEDMKKKEDVKND